MEKNIHEDYGVTMVRLLKSLEYYQEEYGTRMYALNKFYLMIEKQHNRGQEGADIASVKLDSEPGNEYMFREHVKGKNVAAEIFAGIHKHCKNLSQEWLSDVSFAKTNLPFAGDPYMGHLRYSTTDKSDLPYAHPSSRHDNWKAKNLCMHGNLNMTNIGDVLKILTEQGQCPRIYSGTNILLELMGHGSDRKVECNLVDMQKLGSEKRAITNYIEENAQVSNILKATVQHFDGGYVICGLIDSGEVFFTRDPWLIRPVPYYKSDEIVALASECPVLQTTFDFECDGIQELKPGQALIINKCGKCSLQQILGPKQNAVCSFERIYFSRDPDRDTHKERKTLGCQLIKLILETVDYDTEHTVLSYIPNTAEVASYGLVHGSRKQIDKEKAEQIVDLDSNTSSEEACRIIHQDVCSEKVAWKDIKLRTFIIEGNSHSDLVFHVHDATYECIKPHEDNPVVIDDSIARGTILKESIPRTLDRLYLKKIVIVPNMPQTRFSDYYGIDMLHPEEFCIFRTVVELIHEHGTEDSPREVYESCRKELAEPKEETVSNAVHAAYEPLTVDETNKEIVEILRLEDMTTLVGLAF